MNSSFTVSTGPKAIAVGNFNADSLPDLIVISEHSIARMFLFTNQGGGSFTQSAELSPGREPRSVTVGDFNSDGKLDAAAAVTGGNNVLIALGDGQGNLSTPTFYGTGLSPMSIVSGDFNVDGKLDLVTADAATSFLAGANLPGGVSVLLGTGTGVFESYRSYFYPIFANVFFQPTTIAVGDFNNNNRPDLALGFSFSPFVGVMLDDGQGEFIQPVGFFMGAGGNVASLAVGDLNGDNNADIVTANRNTGNISIFFGNGAGNFNPQAPFTVNANPKFVGIGDFNGDGKRDLIVTHEPPANAVILLGDGLGGFTQTGGSPQPAVHEVAVGDFNNDGRSDVAAGNSPQNNVSIFLSDATGHLNLASTTPSAGIQTEMRLHVGDLDGNNQPDVFVANLNRSNISVFLGNGAGGLSEVTNFASEPTPVSITSADFDGDSKLDLAVAINGGQIVSLYSGNGTGGFTPPVPYPVGLNPNGVVSGDFNQDSKPDLAVLSGTSSTVSILKNIVTPLPCLSVNDVTVTEGDAGSLNLDFVITLSQASAQPVRVNYSLVNETATRGPDYTNRSDRLVFAPGETSKTISVPILGDALDEVDETFKLQLASPLNAAIADAEGRGTILDNDPTPTLSINDISEVEASLLRNFTVTLSAPSGQEVKVDFATANGTAIGGTQEGIDFAARTGTLTIPAGQTSGQISVSWIDDSMFEPDETFFVNLSNPINATISDSQGQATIVNNDPIPTVNVIGAFFGAEGNAGTTPASVFVRLSNPTTQTVTLNFATANEDATAGSDYTAVSGSLTFAPGETEKTVVVLINGDTVDETAERFFLDISNVQNATVGESRGTVVIFDDDGPTISINDISITEGNSGTSLATFTLTLSAASVEPISVRAITAPGTATAFSDYNSINVNLNIPVGTVTRTFNVTIIGDTNIESDETFFVNLSNPFNATIADNQGQGTIVDDDGLRLILEESGPDPQQAAALDSLLSVRDPFRVRSIANWWLSLLSDQNTSITIFASNLQLNQGEPASAVTVNLVDGNNQSFDVPAEDVRAVAGVGFTQVVFRLPDNLAPGVCKVAIKANGQTSNTGNIRVVQ
ncbi:MAG TPA: FG-GAP-like repeat-containing protein [Pyrinomonadaceae bacterium]|nr:FG-GAP-like repeat-containing protein [Pyrinomonadaceae bacterium]